MTGKEVIELLIRNMGVKNDNLQSIIDASQESMIVAVSDSSERGRIMQESITERCLSNIKYCRTQQGVYLEVQRWAEQALKEVPE